MVKLIAADMDGTLLNGRKQLSKDMFRVVRELNDRSVRFVVASGRQSFNLAGKFHDTADDLYYISESGAAVFHGMENIYYSEIPCCGVRKILDTLLRIPDIFIVLGGLKYGYYCKDDNPEMIKHAALYYERMKKVEDFEECIGRDPICKIAVYSRDSENLVYPAASTLKPEFTVMLSDSTLVDIMLPGVSKAAAMKILCSRLDIAPEECMAFGDYLNDYDMIRECVNGYAMKNAHPELKKVAAHITEFDNEHHGVIRTICNEFGLAEPGDGWME